MHLKSEQRQNIQLELDFSSLRAGEACAAGREEIESLSAAHGAESPANTNRLMEEVCERENLKKAWCQVKANKGSAGIDRMTVGQLDDYLKQHWPTIREQLLNGTYEPNPQAGRWDAKAWHPDGAGSLGSAGGDAGSATALGSDLLRKQLRVSTGTLGSSSGGTGTAVSCRRLRLVR
jgi:hypothetical protein